MAAQFANEFLAEIETGAARNAIVDFRYNWGGDYTSTLKLTRKLGEALPTDGRIYLIAGPNTFSAGLIGGVRLKHYAGDKVIIVGTPVGDDLKFRAEGFLVTLPATKVRAYLSTARHDLTKKCGLFDDCYITDKFVGGHVGSFEPDIYAENDWRALVDGRDLVLEAVLANIEKRETP